MNEERLRQEICDVGASIHGRGLTHGATGNISVRLDDGWLLTPTGSNLGNLDPDRLSRLDESGEHVSGDRPTKESFLHLAVYDQRPGSGAVVHLHATHSVAVSVLADLDPADLLPPITAYYVMRVGRLPLVPFHAPGDMKLAEAVRQTAQDHHAMLLANHGPVVAGTDLSAALDAAEELEETARLFMLLQGQRTRYLTDDQVAELRKAFPNKA
ncbi:MAG: aldolase [Rhodospirillaceae bacterium]|jgi:3-dehydro-4-phosphotetronate decarboxylase|nr:aldolase [Rhodospirillaceae bacterium]MBT3490791.1 aldolase [Rhodospirillaceae bacterium]MBT3782977.1 aldolase [Rhodospirillaceae bacterium]MBT3976395.1 aldolase [Rhodospirillaceae bacterium]MBT4167907.1 aldolase [Rhodospirillaceae bacterium]